MTGQKPRQIAARVLAQRRSSGGFTEDLLHRALESAAGLAAPDRALCHELVLGVVRWQATLDWLVARKTPGRSQKAALQDLLRLGLYQIFWLDRIPDHAAVHETVEQAKRSGFGPQSGFLNALLRSYLREAEATRRLLAELKTSQPALGWSHPDWLVTRWRQRFGEEPTQQLLAWNNTAPRTFARINNLRTEPGTLLEQWRDESVAYDFFHRPWLGENLVSELKSHPPLASLESFRSGGFYIQDPSTLLAVHELEPRAGEKILDLCAAPGGKTSYIAQRMNNQGQIIAHDAAPPRLKTIEENCARLGVTNVITTAELGGFHVPAFDKILVDAPCSNTGVMRRRVDLRWRITPEEIERLRNTQLALLQQAARLLRAGGVLVYSTCSLESQENGEVINRFLSEASGLALESERSLIPFIDGVDGAYVAKLRRA